MTESVATPTSSPFIPSTVSVAQVMRTVIYALIPGIAVYIILFGWGVLVNIIIAVASALAFEWFMLVARSRPVRAFLFDGSAIVTAILLVLAIPPHVPWWIPVIGCFFAIVVAKHLYGGLGYNSFNPAMAAYAILLISFPLELSLWNTPLEQLQQSLSFIETWQFSLFHTLPVAVPYDAITSATVLDHVRTQVGLGQSIQALNHSPVFGIAASVGYEWVSLGFFVGGLWLIYKKIITWHIPVSMLSALACISGVCYLIDADVFTNPIVQLLSGASILGAFFIATDPITAATTPMGRIIYAAGIGLLTFAIRSWGGYPDGVAFAVLLMGLTVPLLDYYTAPKVYGARDSYGK